MATILSNLMSPRKVNNVSLVEELSLNCNLKAGISIIYVYNKCMATDFQLKTVTKNAFENVLPPCHGFINIFSYFVVCMF